MGIFNRTKKATEEKKTDKKSVKPAVEKKEAKKTEKKPVEKETKPTVKKVSGPKDKTAYKVLLRPVISEKATFGASLSKYVFEIAIDANKVQVKKAVEEIYGVSPKSVNIINQMGKNVRFGRRFGRTKRSKKAIVTLKKGDSIKLYEGI